jgi:peptidyl-prolyl cis-trans isomerase C
MYNRKSSWLIVIVLILIVNMSVAEDSNIPTDPNTVLMTYGNHVLTMNQILWLNPKPDTAMIEKIAEYWLDSQLLYEEALSRKLNKNPKIKFLSEMAAKKVFASELINRSHNAATVDANAVSKYYEDNKEKDPSLKTPLYLSFSHIKTNTLEEAQAVRERIEKGEDINELAKQLSVSNDAKKGGKAGKYQERTVKSRFGDEFLKALLEASEGKIIGPVKAKDGKYEVARHEGRRASKLKKFKDVEKQIKSRLDNEAKQKAVNDLRESLRDKAKSKVKKMGVLNERKNAAKTDTE